MEMVDAPLSDDGEEPSEPFLVFDRWSRSRPIRVAIRHGDPKPIAGG